MSENTKTMWLDLALVARGLMESRAQAQAAIKAGGVLVDGEIVKKASCQVHQGQSIQAQRAHPYVSRGGLKLAAALEAFEVDVAGRVCLDIGASTGGFTDVLLRKGATHVYAVDVGRDQFHASLKDDPRTTCLEGTDARTLSWEMIDRAPDLLVCDTSFIMLEKVLATPLSMLSDEAEAVVLFKPQFQVGPDRVGRGGIVTEQSAVEDAWSAFSYWLKEQGWRNSNRIESPIRGGDGNREYLTMLTRR